MRAGWVACLVLPVALGGCATPPACSPACVSANLQQRTGFALGVSPRPGEVLFPNGTTLKDGLVEEEAVILALWNNALFQELLTELGIARGDLVQAGLLPNPEFVYFWGVPEKPFKYAFDFPIEAFWLRPIRIGAAARESGRVCHRLAQAGLDLIRDTRQAYADLILARERLVVFDDQVELRGKIAKLAQARYEAGDISGQEAATAKIDSLAAVQDRTRFEYDVSLAEQRLRFLMGLGDDCTPLLPIPTAPLPICPPDSDGLVREATHSRPDIMSSDEAIATTAERLRLARVGWVRLLGIGDATSGKGRGHEFGPALRFTVPIFNCNEGNIARAEAELEQATRRKQTLINQAILDVRQAHLRYRQAQAELDVIDQKVRPAVESAILRTQKAYREGNTSFVVVLETTRQLFDTRLRRAQLHADLRRAHADLERSVGRHLAPPVEGPHP